MAAVTRLIYKQVTQHNLDAALKQGAQAKSGGGAMDLRIGPMVSFQPVLHRMFPTAESRTSQRVIAHDPDKVDARGRPRKIYGPVDVEVRVADLHWPEGSLTRTVKAELWEPTQGRGSEYRIGRSGTIAPFLPANMPSPADGERFYFIYQDEDDKLWAAVVSEHALRHDPNAHPEVAGKMLETAAEANAKAGSRAARGWIEFSGGAIKEQAHHAW